MTDTTTRPGVAATEVAHVDVLIVGAGISGIGAAYHLPHQRPGTTFVVLEALESFGGTWLTHNYPGVRSDSDLYTFGYRFKPWTGAPIATAGRDPQVPRRGDRRQRPRRAHPVPAPHHRRDAGRATDSRWTVDVTAHRHR